MCELVNIGERSEKIPTPEFKYSNKLIRNVWDGVISPFILPSDLFEFTFFALSTVVADTFGLPSDFKKGTFGFRRSTQMKNNLSIFSGSKTFQEVLELSSNVLVEGQVMPFNEFKKIGVKINNQYIVNHMETEQQAAFRQSESAANWQDIKEDEDVFPYLKYSTVGDDRVRHDHSEMDGVTARVDDPIWNTWFPPNDWNCRCIVEQLETGTVSKGPFPVNESEVFASNVGKTGLIFPKSHPYYDVPKEFKQEQLRNFGFKTPTDEQIKSYM